MNGDIDNNEKFQGLVDFLGYIWMGEDHRLNELDDAAGTGDSWFVRLARLLANLLSSASQIPIRVLQTVRHTTARHTVETCTNNTSELFFSLSGQYFIMTGTCRGSTRNKSKTFTWELWV